jgi:hypothetical protein
MEANMAFWAIGKWIILFMMWAEASSTGAFENSFMAFPGFFAFLAFHVLLKLSPVCNSSLLFRLNAAILLHHIEVGVVVEIIDLMIGKCYS